MIGRRAGLLVGVVVGLMLLTGCDRHAAALAGPSGESLERVRMATIDVVLDKGYTVLQAPLCSRHDGAITCKGTTTDGQAIEATSAKGSRDDVTISVAGTQLYEGTVRAVIEDAARAG